ncbi:DUF1801 domain-containing protein [Herbiconiux sp. KACC 21604]|uniref:DUF1801 domain-containing protein n=1 Tax=unclassified Herbiconiux TaxID=2618217 RepID=UPI001492135C|nr:DUF1801 domain-containing protein [Herbiconiux sp. SALV-R1]QJU53266.1 DUF1801 domain-containing protein [Herbiconiux sp. SALV-R1]WPO88224.1 DUF1801 domain-containing protein [Herbiconiux sp. KACC 21604]
MTAARSDEGSFSAEERRAMKERAAELKAQARQGKAAEKAKADADAQAAKIAAMDAGDRAMAERLHAIVAEAAPELQPKLYYGQPGWARDGKVVVFFRSGVGDKERYSTLGFSSAAALDDTSGLWETAYALTRIDETSAERIASLVRKAAG